MPSRMAGGAMPPPGILIFDRRGGRAVDTAACEEFGLPTIVLMENAARAIAEEAVALLRAGNGGGGDVLIVCGGGNNGGDGLAAARHLSNAGIPVSIRLLTEPPPGGDAHVQLRVCRSMGLRLLHPEDETRLDNTSLVIDALFGTGLDRPVTGAAAVLIERINSAGLPVIAADTPSGLDCDTGAPLGVAIRAARTVSFLGWKKAFLNPNSRQYTGTIVVADIGVPRQLLDRFAIPPV